MTVQYDGYRDELAWAVDTLLDFDRKPLRSRHIRLAFGGSKPDIDIVVYAVSVMASHLAGISLNKIIIHDDITNKRWSTSLYDVAYVYGAEIIHDWRTYGSGTDTSLYDYIMYYVHMIEETAKDVPVYSLSGKDDMVVRNGRRIPKILDVDGVVLLPVP